MWTLKIQNGRIRAYSINMHGKQYFWENISEWKGLVTVDIYLKGMN